jgi:hypothetical protein
MFKLFRHPQALQHDTAVLLTSYYHAHTRAVVLENGALLFLLSYAYFLLYLQIYHTTTIEITY